MRSHVTGITSLPVMQWPRNHSRVVASPSMLPSKQVSTLRHRLLRQTPPNGICPCVLFSSVSLPAQPSLSLACVSQWPSRHANFFRGQDPLPPSLTFYPPSNAICPPWGRQQSQMPRLLQHLQPLELPPDPSLSLTVASFPACAAPSCPCKHHGNNVRA